ncbi:hypothetical protein RJ639_008758 [Escallonia herrerae]|uniref:Transposase (putative) gypsy type domain-containing protein n=1 Tax=Escallonia herrerae TaxID=1293975 RepID=A0AA88VUD4_9ASTE|nr:hypothetical protein RJ639_008758 [Escallonia herrerae]
MTKEELEELIREYPLPQSWIARVPELQEPINYGTDWELGIYEEQIRSGYRLSLHPFALKMFDHYKMAPGQLVPNSWRKLVGLIYLIETSGYKVDPIDFMRVLFEICFVKDVTNSQMASDRGKTMKTGFLGTLQKANGERKEKLPTVELPLLRRGPMLLFLSHLLELSKECL